LRHIAPPVPYTALFRSSWCGAGGCGRPSSTRGNCRTPSSTTPSTPAMPCPRGGKLTIETANMTVDADYAEAHGISPGQYVMVAVTDTGTGMAPEVVARAFDPFFTTKEVGKGSGLGLSMVYGFARQSGGHAKIYSEPG